MLHQVLLVVFVFVFHIDLENEQEIGFINSRFSLLIGMGKRLYEIYCNFLFNSNLLIVICDMLRQSVANTKLTSPKSKTRDF